MLIVRPEQSEDTTAIHRLNVLAFDRANEADLVDLLRSSGALTLSLVAVVDGGIVAHIVFSPVIIESTNSRVEALGLGPLAVLPGRQGLGFGTKLVEAGLSDCAKSGHRIVVVLGDPDFYRRFGFVSAKSYGIQWEHDVPEEVFLVKELEDGALSQVKGVVRYRPEFNAV